MAAKTTKLECWAIIKDDKQRKAAMNWIRAGKFYGYSELGEKVSATYIKNPDDPDGDRKLWEVIDFFGQYPEHGIFGTNIQPPRPRR